MCGTCGRKRIDECTCGKAEEMRIEVAGLVKKGYTREQILDPVHSANVFYDALVKVDGYESMVITEVAQKVQKSAYPDAYADHEQEGRTLASTLRGQTPAGGGCRTKGSGGFPHASWIGRSYWQRGRWTADAMEQRDVDRCQLGSGPVLQVSLPDRRGTIAGNRERSKL